MTDDARRLALLDELMAAFNAHDADAIVAQFTDDGEFLLAAGPEPHGTLFTGRKEIAAALKQRFAAVPDIAWSGARSWVSGDRGTSEWVVSGTLADGGRLNCLGCDPCTFRGDKIARKDTYYKQVTA